MKVLTPAGAVRHSSGLNEMSRGGILIVAGAMSIPATTCIISIGLLIAASNPRDRQFALFNAVSSAILGVAIGLLIRGGLILRRRRISGKRIAKRGGAR